MFAPKLDYLVITTNLFLKRNRRKCDVTNILNSQRKMFPCVCQKRNENWDVIITRILIEYWNTFVWLLGRPSRPWDNILRIRVICVYLFFCTIRNSTDIKKGFRQQLFSWTSIVLKFVDMQWVVTLWFWCVITPLYVLRFSIVQKRIISFFNLPFFCNWFSNESFRGIWAF